MNVETETNGLLTSRCSAFARDVKVVFLFSRWLQILTPQPLIDYKFLCVGQISLPPDGDTFIVLPGKNVTVAWKIDVNISVINIRQWTFLPKGNFFADIFFNLGVNKYLQNSPGPFTIEKPSTLILKNVNIEYNGTYRFKITDRNGITTSSDVAVFVAGKWLLFNILPFYSTSPNDFCSIFCINKLLYFD